MTLRAECCCTICEKNYLLRIGVGHMPSQTHTFECVTCQSNITISFSKDNGINYIEHCQREYLTDEEPLVYNLHPELLIPEEELHSEYYSSNIFESHRILSKMNLENFDEEDLNMSANMTNKFLDIEKNYQVIKVAWKMIQNKKNDSLVKKQLKKYKTSDKSLKDASFNKILYDFNNALLFPSFISKPYHDFFSQIEQQITECQKENKLKKLNHFYKENLLSNNMKKFLNIYDLFFQNFSEYNQILFYVHTSTEIPLSHTVTSKDFNQTKSFYGMLYEAYTNNVSLI